MCHTRSVVTMNLTSPTGSMLLLLERLSEIALVSHPLVSGRRKSNRCDQSITSKAYHVPISRLIWALFGVCQ